MDCRSKSAAKFRLVLTMWTLVSAILTGQPALAEEDRFASDWWPMLNHDSMNSGYSHSTVPDSPVVLWSIPAKDFLPGDGLAVYDGKVCLIKDDRVSGAEILACFDAITGHELWQFEPSISSESFGGTPTMDGDRVYLGTRRSPSGPGAMYCLNTDSGELIWRNEVSSIGCTGSSAIGAIISNAEVVYKTSQYHDQGIDPYVVSKSEFCDRLTGEGVRTVDFGDTSVSLPALVNGTDMYVSHNMSEYYPWYLWKVDAETGEVIWNVEFFDESPIVVDQRIYGFDYGELVCRSAANGQMIWSYPIGMMKTPAVNGGKLYAAMSDGWFRCFDVATGEVIWARDCDTPWTSGVSAGNGKVLAAMGGGGGILCLDAENGKKLWKYTIPSPHGASGYRPIVIADGRIYITNVVNLVLHR